jgi:N-acetyl-gamma-glutamylphosphate reductase
VEDEQLMAEGAGLLVDAVGELPAEDVDRVLRGLPAPVATELVRELLGNKLDVRRLKHVGSLVVGSLQKRRAPRLIPVVERLSTGIFETFHVKLGDRFDNPSLADLREVLDAVLADHPVAAVRCALSYVAADGLLAAEAARDLLLSEPRLRLPQWRTPPVLQPENEENPEGYPAISRS